MIQKRLICPGRERRVPRQFSWIDTRLVSAGYVQRCGTEALALYLFLVIVGDSQGLSYYSERTIIKLLSLNEVLLRAARESLIRAGLIAYQAPLYQVLSLDTPQTSRKSGEPESFAQILSSALRLNK